MLIVFHVKEVGPTPGVMKREINNVLKEAWRLMLLYWHKRFIPQHFREIAKSLYDYKPRSKRYEARKKRLKGHTKPLVFTGETETLSRTVTVRSTFRGGRMRMPIRKLNYRRLRPELEALTAGEVMQLERRFENEVVRGMKGLKARARERI